MKIQLFVPPGGYFAERWSKGSSMPPLGLLYIGAVLEKEGIEVEIVPADILKMGWSDIARKIQDGRPDIVGVTSTTENRFQSFKLVRLAKKAYPPAMTVMGGPHASMAAEDALAHIPGLDIVVRGEGEETTLDLCRALERKKDANGISQVAGITHRLNGQVISNPPRSPILNLDALPLPGFPSRPLREIQLPDRRPRQRTSSRRQYHDQPGLPLQLQLLRHTRELGKDGPHPEPPKCHPGDRVASRKIRFPGHPLL